MIKLTVDVGLMGQQANDTFVQKLQGWMAAGLVEVHQAGAAPKAAPVAPPPEPMPKKTSFFSASKGRSTPITGSGSATFKSIAAILFPGRDSTKLSMGEINNVVYLIKHHSMKNQIFVTTSDCYISKARQQDLKSYHGIVTMTPEQAVTELTRQMMSAY